MHLPAPQHCRCTLFRKPLAALVGRQMRPVCHRSSAMRRQAPSRAGSHDLHVLYVRYFYVVSPALRLLSEHLHDTLRLLFADAPSMSAASSCAGIREVTMSFLPNARRPCLAKDTNVSIVASLPYPLFCSAYLCSILASPFVSQNLLTNTSRSVHRYVRPISLLPSGQKQHTGNAAFALAPPSTTRRDIWRSQITRRPQRLNLC